MKRLNLKNSIYIATYVAIILGAAYRIYRKVAVKGSPKKESRQKPLYGLKKSCDRAAKSDRMLGLTVSDALYDPIPRVVFPSTPLDTIWAHLMVNDIHRKFAESVSQGDVSVAIDRALESHYAAQR